MYLFFELLEQQQPSNGVKYLENVLYPERMILVEGRTANSRLSFYTGKLYLKIVFQTYVLDLQGNG